MSSQKSLDNYFKRQFHNDFIYYGRVISVFSIYSNSRKSIKFVTMLDFSVTVNQTDYIPVKDTKKIIEFSQCALSSGIAHLLSNV
jgi:hypothetical protein